MDNYNGINQWADSGANVNNGGNVYRQEAVRYCAECGSPLQAGALFCTSCGAGNNFGMDMNTRRAIDEFNANVGSKKNGGKAAVIAAIAIGTAVVVAGISIFAVYNNNRRVKRYKEDAREFANLTLETGGTMEDIGNEIQKFWGSYVGGTRYYHGYSMYSVDDAVEAAQSYKSSEISEVREKDNTITQMYSKLAQAPSSKLSAIEREIGNTYTAYREMYDVVITVEGNYTTYKSKFSDADSQFANAVKTLNAVLP